MNPGLVSGVPHSLAEPSAPADRPSTTHPAMIRPAHHLRILQSPKPTPPAACIGRIGPDPWGTAAGQHQSGPVPVLCWRRESPRPRQPGGVHYDVALAPGHLFAGVVAARPPFSVVFTEMIAPLGGIPSLALPAGTQCLQNPLVPSLRQIVPPDRPQAQAGRGASFARKYRHATLACRSPPPAGKSETVGNRGQAPLGIGQISGIRSSIHTPKLQAKDASFELY